LLHLENECAWFGSANLTSNSLRGNAIEAAVRIQDSDILGGLRDAFDDVWSFSSLSMMSHSGSVSLRESRPDPKLSRQLRRQEWDIGGDTRLLVSHPGGVPILSKTISDLIAKASSEVIFVAMTLFETDMIPHLGETLEHCLERGLDVRAVVRPDYFKEEDYPDPATSRLLRSGMKLLGVTGLHAKGFLIDGKWCGLQSANFNPYSLNPECDTANVEFGLFGTAYHPVFSEWTAMIRYLADHPTHEFLSRV
jgi:phosphatidylserine/phosphatidylglycerophosphate/cardiolipin synthase-like enzyme